MDVFVSALMALYHYFKPVSKSLPDLEGPLSEALPTTSIKAANEAVLAAMKESNEWPSKSTKGGHYVKLTGVQQAQIARYACSHGNQATICQYNKKYSTETLLALGSLNMLRNLITNEKLEILRQVEKLR